MEKISETAVFGGGCFWCTEAIFQNLRGVTAVTPGYAGGDTEDPAYEQVSGGATGHAEVIRVEFDPGVIRFTDLLEVFFALHDPTTKDRQGDDVGTQYRSIILYTSPGQELSAREMIERLTKDRVYGNSVVTELKPLDKFYEAEQSHLNYYARNMDKPYCQTVINPKLLKLREKFGKLIGSK